MHAKRSANFSVTETELLIYFVEKYIDIIECKKNDQVTNKLKVKIWEEITQKFNAASVTVRTAPTLRGKWESFKTHLRKEYAITPDGKFLDTDPLADCKRRIISLLGLNSIEDPLTEDFSTSNDCCVQAKEVEDFNVIREFKEQKNTNKIEHQKQRSANFNVSETELLISFVEKFIDILECKKTDQVTNNLKTKTWEEIAEKFNASSVTIRTAKALRGKWDSFKTLLRKDYATSLDGKFLDNDPLADCKKRILPLLGFISTEDSLTEDYSTSNDYYMQTEDVEDFNFTREFKEETNTNEIEHQRQRSANFNVTETKLLISFVEKSIDIIECKKTDQVTNNLKTKTWEDIAEKFNAASVTIRTAKTLRVKWESFKRFLKKDYTTSPDGKFLDRDPLADCKRRILPLLGFISIEDPGSDCLMQAEEDGYFNVIREIKDENNILEIEESEEPYDLYPTKLEVPTISKEVSTNSLPTGKRKMDEIIIEDILIKKKCELLDCQMAILKEQSQRKKELDEMEIRMKQEKHDIEMQILRKQLEGYNK